MKYFGFDATAIHPFFCNRCGQEPSILHEKTIRTRNKINGDALIETDSHGVINNKFIAQCTNVSCQTREIEDITYEWTRYCRGEFFDA